jgi:sugar phosphate isomerase/epimerase
MSAEYSFGVSEFTTWPWSFDQDVAAYAKLGVDAIEICEFKLPPGNIDEALKKVRDAGLKITSVQSQTHSLFPDAPRPEPKSPSDRMARLRKSIERFKRAADTATFVSITGAAPEANFREAFDVAVREYRALARFAAGHGARVAVEPLNPILMNADTFICSLSDGLRLVEAVNEPNFGIFVDVWHIWQDTAAPELIKKCGKRIFGVHVNDWHAPRHFGDRAVIGRGEIPLAKLLQAIRASGYNGAYTLELFSIESLPDSLWKSDLEKVIIDSRSGFETAWRKSCV